MMEQMSYAARTFLVLSQGQKANMANKNKNQRLVYGKKGKKFQPKSSSQNDDVIAAYFFHEILLMKVAFRGGGGLKLT